MWNESCEGILIGSAAFDEFIDLIWYVNWYEWPGKMCYALFIMC